jgi:hypothetical protein
MTRNLPGPWAPVCGMSLFLGCVWPARRYGLGCRSSRDTHSADLRIAVFGGAGEIGGNRILLSWDDAAWMLDFGTCFAATSRYFEEFVKPRGATLGLRDYLRMGLLPPLPRSGTDRENR